MGSTLANTVVEVASVEEEAAVDEEQDRRGDCGGNENRSMRAQHGFDCGGEEPELNHDENTDEGTYRGEERQALARGVH